MASRHVIINLILLLTIGMKIMVIQAIATRTTREVDAPEPASEVDLHRLTTSNSNAIKKLADVMSTLITQTSSERCQNAGSTTAQLTSTIRDGFTVIVDAIQDLNTTLHHYKAKISKKAFGAQADTAFQNDGPCPHPFFLAEDQCLYIETERLRSFDAARQACIEMGAKLAEFTTFTPFINAVSNMDLHGDAEVYIGATDRQNEGTFRYYSSGNRVSGVPWGYSEPNNLGGEDCMALKPNWKKFNDLRCTLKREFVCEWETE